MFEHPEARRQTIDGFDAMYSGKPPWDIDRPQPEFERLAETGALRGRVLDIGCGTGEHAIMAARIGLDATGIDAAPTAIGIAKKKAEQRGVRARFLVHDALDLEELGDQFDIVLDSGLFHVFDDADRVRYVRSLAAAIEPGGIFYMLCFSDRVPGGDFGPRRVTHDEIRASFQNGWKVRSIESSHFDVNFSPEGVHAWLSTIERT